MCVDAAKELEAAGKKVRVVSLMCWELFEAQGQAYKDKILPPDVEARVSIEAGSTFGWTRYVGFKVLLCLASAHPDSSDWAVGRSAAASSQHLHSVCL